MNENLDAMPDADDDRSGHQDFRAIVKLIATEEELTEAQVRRVVRSLVNHLGSELKQGHTVRISGLGAFRVRDGSDGPRKVVLNAAKGLLEA